jgi:hypothetical protein
VGFALPLLVLGAALGLQGRIRAVSAFRPILGGVLVLIIAGGWYLAASYLGGDAFVEKHLLKENVFRFLGTTRLQSGHAHPFYYYVPTLAAGFLPWTPALIVAVLAALRFPSRRDPRVLFLLVWLAVVFVFYSAASAKRSVYLLALYPAAALLTGWWWEGLTSKATMPQWLRGRPARLIAAVVAGVLAVPLLLTIGEVLGFAPFTLFAPLLHPKDQANLPLVREAVRETFPIVLAALAAMLGSLALFLTGLRAQRWTRVSVSAVTLAVALWVLVFGVFQPELARRRTLRPFLAHVVRETAGHPLFFYRGTFDFGAAFYAPEGMRHWRSRDARAAGPRYLLVWDVDFDKFADSGLQFEVLGTSEGTNPKGNRRLTLVRVP